MTAVCPAGSNSTRSASRPTANFPFRGNRNRSATFPAVRRVRRWGESSRSHNSPSRCWQRAIPPQTLKKSVSVFHRWWRGRVVAAHRVHEAATHEVEQRPALGICAQRRALGRRAETFQIVIREHEVMRTRFARHVHAVVRRLRDEPQPSALLTWTMCSAQPVSPARLSARRITSSSIDTGREAR